MPIFEYKCRRCGRIFEVLVMGRNDDSPLSCPDCKCKKADKVPSLFSGKVEGSSSSIGGKTSSCSGCTSSSCASCK